MQGSVGGVSYSSIFVFIVWDIIFFFGLIFWVEVYDYYCMNLNKVVNLFQLMNVLEYYVWKVYVNLSQNLYYRNVFIDFGSYGGGYGNRDLLVLRVGSLYG